MVLRWLPPPQALDGPVQNRLASTLQAQQCNRCAVLLLSFSLLEAARVMGKERARTAALHLLGLSLRGCFSLCDTYFCSQNRVLFFLFTRLAILQTPGGIPCTSFMSILSGSFCLSFHFSSFVNNLCAIRTETLPSAAGPRRSRSSSQPFLTLREILNEITWNSIRLSLRPAVKLDFIPASDER